MKDYRASVEKLRRDAAEAALTRDLATDKNKRELFDRLHQHFSRLADEVEHAMTAGGMQALEDTSSSVPPETPRHNRAR